MRVYLAVPIIANRSISRARRMAKAIRECGHEVTSPWVLETPAEAGSSRVNVFERDTNGSESCDVLVADVTTPSIGVGMEIMAAHKAGKRVIVVARRGVPFSTMLVHMEGKETLVYDDESEIYERLTDLLSASKSI